MDNKLYNLKSSVVKEFIEKKYDKTQLKILIEDNLESLLKIRKLASNYCIDKGRNDYIETLGIDEANRLVIIEYRIGKFSRVIQNGLLHIDYINKHLSEFKILVSDNGINDEVNYNTRLVVIGDAFHQFDGESIRMMPYNIELITCEIYANNNLLLNKTYVSRNIDMSSFNYKYTNEEREIIAQINEFCLSLGEEVVISGFNNIIFYRKISMFLCIVLCDGINVLINGGTKKISSIKDLTKFNVEIEKSYDKN